MLIYQYKCPKCGGIMESESPDLGRDESTATVWCVGRDKRHEKTAYRRVYGVGGVILKGSGFYRNDK